MFNILKGSLLAAAFLITISACSTTKSASDSSGKAMYPVWFTPSGFASDSVSFYGYASAVSSDSVIAIANAELQARSQLESSLASQVEEVREKLEEDGSTIATNSDFILTLRNAHQNAEASAKDAQGVAFSKDGYFVGFAEVSISRSEFMTLMENGFRGKQSYWNAIQSSLTSKILSE